MESMNELDRILTEEEIVSPSADFTARVMRQVRSEADAPAPIEFPWRRFLPGVLTGLSLVMATFTAMVWMQDRAPQSGRGPAVDAEVLAWLDSAQTALSTPAGGGVLLAGAAVAVSGLLAWWFASAANPDARGL